MALRRENEIRSDKLVQHLTDGNERDYWREARKRRSRTRYYPNMVDDVIGEKDIVQLFSDKYQNLYNSVSYDSNEMQNIILEINSKIDLISSCCSHGNHDISVTDVLDAVAHLNSAKIDGSTNIMSDHIIHGSDRLCVYVSLLFTMMLKLGMSPEAWHVP